MKIGGIIVGVTGALMMVWHLVKVMTGADEGAGITTHHMMSLVGGLLILSPVSGFTSRDANAAINERRRLPRGGQ